MKKVIISFICGAIIFSVITAYAITKYNASEILFVSEKKIKQNYKMQ